MYFKFKRRLKFLSRCPLLTYLSYYCPIFTKLSKFVHLLLYRNMIILYNGSSDWSRKSRGRENKWSCIPGNKCLTSSEISGFFIPKVRNNQYEHSMWTNTIKSKIFYHLNSLYIKKCCFFFTIFGSKLRK